ncbi:MAG TPA: TPM domain-containing protein [Candidatus Elarobacter sp.]|nr:TPM domain-containing protein [Candidatus Elarobacter sp.]
MRAGRWFAAPLLLLCLAAAPVAGEVAVPAAPAQWATDTAHILQPQTVAAVNARLRAYESTTGHQVLLYVAPTTGITPTEDWTIHAFTKWKVGRKGLDDGLVLFVFPTDRKARIEVGYGLEGVMTDALASNIIRDTIAPKMLAGQPDAAVSDGIGVILSTLGGEARAQGVTPAPAATFEPYNSSDDQTDPVGVLIGVVLALLIIVLVFWVISKLPRGKDTYISSGGGGGWGGLLAGALLSGAGGLGGGGGFMGGGGMGGGGGATGSW